MVVTLTSQETYKKILLKNRAKRLGLEPPAPAIPPGRSPLGFLFFVTLTRPIRMLFTEPVVASLSVYIAFNFGVLYGFFAAFPIIFESPYPEVKVYHFNTGESGLVFLAVGVGVLIGTAIVVTIDRLYYVPKTLRRRAQGNLEPLPAEERLYAMMIASFLVPIGLFWFAWSAKEDVHWISPVLATIPFACGNYMIFANAMSYKLDAYGGLTAASASAANGLARYMLAAVFPLFIIQM
jgi:hypothetical protein